MFKDVIPLGKDILIRAFTDQEDTKTDSGLYVPEEANEFKNKLFRAEVLKIGPDCIKIKIGDFILCKFNTGLEVDYDVIMMKEDDVIGRF